MKVKNWIFVGTLSVITLLIHNFLGWDFVGLFFLAYVCRATP